MRLTLRNLVFWGREGGIKRIPLSEKGKIIFGHWLVKLVKEALN